MIEPAVWQIIERIGQNVNNAPHIAVNAIPNISLENWCIWWICQFSIGISGIICVYVVRIIILIKWATSSSNVNVQTMCTLKLRNMQVRG